MKESENQVVAEIISPGALKAMKLDSKGGGKCNI